MSSAVTESRRLSGGWSLCWLGLIALSFACYTYLLGVFDWDYGVERALLLLLALLTCSLLLLQHRRPLLLVTSTRWKQGLVLAGCGLLLTVQVLYLAWHYPNAQLIDIATTTRAAGETLLAGNNPYTEPVDPRPESQQSGESLDGYKYGPLMALLYLPLSAPLGLQGIQLTNLLVQLAVAGAAAALAVRLAGTTAGLFALFLYLSIPFAPSELFKQGVTDLAAVLPLLVAFLMLEGGPLAAGLLVGMSISTKLLPGGLFAILCLPATGRVRYLTGLVLGLVPLGVVTALAPAAMVSNQIVFNMIRAPDATSWLQGMPELVSQLARLVFLGVMLAALVYVWHRPPALHDRMVLTVVCLLVLLLSGTICHRNYLLWWLPFFAVLLASAALTRERAPLRETGFLPYSFRQ